MNIFLFAIALNHGAISDQIWSGWGWFLHFLKYLGSFFNSITSDATIDHWVKSHIIRFNLIIKLHNLVNFQGLIKFERLCKTLNQSSKNDSIQLDSILFHSIEDLHSSINLVVFNTSINEATICHWVWNEITFLHFSKYKESIFELVSLTISFNQDTISYRTWLDIG